MDVGCEDTCWMLDVRTDLLDAAKRSGFRDVILGVNGLHALNPERQYKEGDS